MNDSSNQKESSKMEMALIAGVVIASIVILIIAYNIAVATGMGKSNFETMCGGSDQGCHCSGNETMVNSDLSAD